MQAGIFSSGRACENLLKFCCNQVLRAPEMRREMKFPLSKSLEKGSEPLADTSLPRIDLLSTTN